MKLLSVKDIEKYMDDSDLGEFFNELEEPSDCWQATVKKKELVFLVNGKKQLSHPIKTSHKLEITAELLSSFIKLLKSNNIITLKKELARRFS